MFVFNHINIARIQHSMNRFGRAGFSLKMSPNVEFFYDIQCPWSYIASKRIEQVVQRANATVKWIPVSLNGISEITNATKVREFTAKLPVFFLTNQLRQDVWFVFTRISQV